MTRRIATRIWVEGLAAGFLAVVDGDRVLADKKPLRMPLSWRLTEMAGGR